VVEVDVTELTVATDGSVGCAPGVGWSAGWGWITHEGSTDAGHLAGVRHPTVAEVVAVARVCGSVQRNRPLQVLTDSRDAVLMVDRLLAGEEPMVIARAVPARYHVMVTKALTTIRRRAVTGPVEVSWVKGHAGHQLQEVADRLAVLGRRRYQAGLNDLERRIQEIAAEFVRMSLPASSVTQ